jgi:hypothetical protein
MLRSRSFWSRRQKRRNRTLPDSPAGICPTSGWDVLQLDARGIESETMSNFSGRACYGSSTREGHCGVSLRRQREDFGHFNGNDRRPGDRMATGSALRQGRSGVLACPWLGDDGNQMRAKAIRYAELRRADGLPKLHFRDFSIRSNKTFDYPRCWVEDYLSDGRQVAVTEMTSDRAKRAPSALPHRRQ